MELEDEAEDVLQKACRGLELPYDPTWSLEEAARRLNVNYEALTRLETYTPTASLPDEVKCHTTEFGHIGVNSWQIGTHLFDTGTNGEQIRETSGQLTGITITHGHHDHVGGYSVLRPYVETAWCPSDQPIDQAETLKHGEICLMSGYQFRCLDVTGHATPTHAPKALAYYTDETEVPLCVIGDAIFAGSMGGCRNAAQYEQLMSNVRDHILTLPPKTLLLPGHGPATTVEQELLNNPFLAR